MFNEITATLPPLYARTREAVAQTQALVAEALRLLNRRTEPLAGVEVDDVRRALADARMAISEAIRRFDRKQ